MEKTRKCPYCGEEIMADARKCKHCGEWLNDEAEPKQEPVQETGKKEPESQLKKQPIIETSPITEPVVKGKPVKSNKIWLIIIAIAVVIALAVGGLFLFGSFGEKDPESTVMENNVEKDLETQVVEAYRTHEIYNLQTADFKAAEDAAIASDVPGVATCIDWDYFYATQEDPDLTRVTNVQAEIVDENKAHVYVTLENEWESEPETLILVMIRDGQKGKWLVDDVRTTGKYTNSIKDLMINCAKESEGSDDYVDDGSDYNKEEVEDESTLDLGSVSYVDYYNPRFDFSVSYPTFFVRKYEAANQDGCEFLYGDNYLMKAYGMNCVSERTVKELFEDSKRSTDTYSTFKDNWFVLSGVNEQGNIYYRKTIIENKVEYVVELVYPQAKKAEYDAVVKKVISSFQVMGGKDEDGERYVVIDGSELRLRLGPSTSSETLKWEDGSNRHPEVGEKFRLLDESGNFYKIDYKGNEVWVSKQFSHIEIQ